MKLIFVPVDSVRILPDDVTLLREDALSTVDDLRTQGYLVTGQHVITSADGTAVWLLIVLEK